jgi:predicted nucleic acid-binding protein
VILLDTNIVIDAHDRRSRFRASSSALIAEAVVTGGAAINVVALAELCAGQKDPEAIEAELRAEGVSILDLPTATAPICGRAYRRYRLARKKSGGSTALPTPLPDFFIGAHAELMGWSLATRDTERYRFYFPHVKLLEPSAK